MTDKDLVVLSGAITVSVIVTLAFMAVCLAVFFVEIPAGQKDVANILFGFLGGAFGAVVAYWVGSSVGSARKDATVSKLTETKP